MHTNLYKRCLQQAEVGVRAQDLCERGSGRPVPTSPYGLSERKATLNTKPAQTELGGCVKEKVDVQVSPSLIVLPVPVDVKQQMKRKKWRWPKRGSCSGLAKPRH